MPAWKPCGYQAQPHVKYPNVQCCLRWLSDWRDSVIGMVCLIMRLYTWHACVETVWISSTAACQVSQRTMLLAMIMRLFQLSKAAQIGSCRYRQLCADLVSFSLRQTAKSSSFATNFPSGSRYLWGQLLLRQIMLMTSKHKTAYVFLLGQGSKCLVLSVCCDKMEANFHGSHHGPTEVCSRQFKSLPR